MAIDTLTNPVQNNENLQKFMQFRQSTPSADLLIPKTDEINPLQTIQEIKRQASEVISNVPNKIEGSDVKENQNFNEGDLPPELGTLDKLLGAKGKLTQGYGNENSIYKSGVHSGIDIAVPTGTSVALPNGQWKIVKSFNEATASGPNNAQENLNGGYGNSILAQNVETGEMIRLSHLSKVGVGAGQTVQGGKVIALTGATGKTRGNTGQHIDIEYYNSQGKRSDILKSPYAQYIL